MSKNELITLAASKGYTLKKNDNGVYTVFDAANKGIKRCGKMELIKFLSGNTPVAIPAGTAMDLRQLDPAQRDMIIAQMQLG